MDINISSWYKNIGGQRQQEWIPKLAYISGPIQNRQYKLVEILNLTGDPPQCRVKIIGSEDILPLDFRDVSLINDIEQEFLDDKYPQEYIDENLTKLYSNLSIDEFKQMMKSEMISEINIREFIDYLYRFREFIDSFV